MPCFCVWVDAMVENEIDKINKMVYLPSLDIVVKIFI